MARLTSLSAARLTGAALAAGARALAWPLGPWHGGRMRAELAARAAPVHTLRTARGALRFHCAGAEAVKAAARFGDDEPETIWWIDTLVEPGACVWDVGANVGLYTLYAALRLGEGGTVIAFEPGADNYAALTRNLALNPTGAEARAFCLALSDETRAAELHLTSLDAGRAAHVFGNVREAQGAEPRPFTQAALGFTADALVDGFGLRPPDHVKIDVDSIEERILRGGAKAFAGARSLIVETNVPRPPDRHVGLMEAITALGFKLHDESAVRWPGGRNRIFVRG